jgi:hypothetical protein
MTETFENNVESEKQCLIIDNRIPDEESIPIYGLNFPSSLIYMVKKISRLLRSKERINDQEIFRILLQLIVAFTICIPSILIGAIFLNERYETKQLCIFLMLQGICGFFIVVIHLCAVILE